jgi:hypothetical protein
MAVPESTPFRPKKEPRRILDAGAAAQRADLPTPRVDPYEVKK